MFRICNHSTKLARKLEIGGFIQLNASVVYFIILILFNRKGYRNLMEKIFRSRSVKNRRGTGLERRSGSAFQVSSGEREVSRTKLGVEGQGSLHAMTAQLPRGPRWLVRSLDLRDRDSLSSLSLSEWVLVEFVSLRVLSRASCSILPLNWTDNSKQDPARSFDSTVITFIRCTVCNLNVIRLAFYGSKDCCSICTYCPG